LVPNADSDLRPYLRGGTGQVHSRARNPAMCICPRRTGVCQAEAPRNATLTEHLLTAALKSALLTVIRRVLRDIGQHGMFCKVNAMILTNPLCASVKFRNTFISRRPRQRFENEPE
jgi:hypothetical protein